MAAENMHGHEEICGRICGFNEAAANGRGKPSSHPLHQPRFDRFNEAAANGRGKRPGRSWASTSGVSLQ